MSTVNPETAWKLLHREGEKAFGSSGVQPDTEYVRTIRFASPSNECTGGVDIREGYNYNGSGPEAFGGAKKWPHVTLRVALPEGRLDLRAALGAHLRASVDAFIAAYGLEPEP